MESQPLAIFRQDGTPTYWLTRFVLLRLLGLVYAVAFLVAINQIIPLVGSNGLLPVGLYLKQVSQAYGSVASGFMHLPSIFWLWHSDTALLVVAWVGFLLSLAMIAGYTNGLSLTLLWLLYMSFNHVGQDWYGYGWEIQLTETGFLAIFLCPFLDMRPFPKQPPAFPVIVLFRWLTFRIMFGAGLIKFRGDAVWRKGTALNYFFETQPLPGPLSRWFHFLPQLLLKIGVWFNWLAELIAPLFVFWPRIGRHIAGIVIVGFQIIIILSGNLSFLNWLTVVPAIACFDDVFLAQILPRRLVRKAAAAAQGIEVSVETPKLTWIVTIILGVLSVEPALNILSTKQIMNGSFDPLGLVNTYGAFGTIGKERPNVVFEGTTDDTTGGKAKWTPYIYKGLPVLLNKRPTQIAPYQLRLDWQMWFASMSTADQYPWTYNLVWKLLHNDKDAVGLFSGNPFMEKPPRYIRATLYVYKFAKPGNPQNLYWTRQKAGDWIPALSVDNPVFLRYLKGMEWVK